MARVTKKSKEKESEPTTAEPAVAIKRTKKTLSSGVSTLFAFEAPQAQSVVIAGSFNSWEAGSIPLKKNKEGRWSTTIDLSPGTYEYRYIVDGTWVSDAQSPAVANPFGSSNNVIQIRS